MPKRLSTQQFLLCVKNDGYPASLEVREVYRSLPDATSSAKGFVRVVDESGDDYLYPAEHFIAVELPKAAVDALLAS
jgi:hypothetical protein